MANKRTPNDVASIKGRMNHDPARYKGRSNPKVAPLGRPFVAMTTEQKRLWYQYKKEMPWLRASDRRILQLTIFLTTAVEEAPKNQAMIAELRRHLSALGATPTDRSKVIETGELSDQEIEEKYFN